MCIPLNLRKLRIFNRVEARITGLNCTIQMVPKMLREGDDKAPANVLQGSKVILILV